MYLILLLMPNIALASFESFMTNFYREIYNPVITFFIVLGVAYFFYGVFIFMSNMDNDEKRTTGKKHMIYGLIGLVVMVSVWGIIQMLLNTFNIEGIDLESGPSQSSDTGLSGGSGTNTGEGDNVPDVGDISEGFDYVAPPSDFDDIDFDDDLFDGLT